MEFLPALDLKFEWVAVGARISPHDQSVIRTEFKRSGVVVAKTVLGLNGQELNDQLLAFGNVVGKPAVYEGEGGDLIGDVTPSREVNDGETSYKSHNDFALHVDMSYTAKPPDYLACLFVRQDQHNQARTRLSFLNDAIKDLPREAVVELSKPNYAFSAPVRAGHAEKFSQDLPVLAKHSDGYRVRYREDLIVPKNKSADDALKLLTDAFERAVVEFVPPAGTLLLIDNRTVLHARTSFVPTYDSNDKLMKRLYLTADL